ncbi:hypothetical protein [Parabacteroides sp. AM08-6]|uniref:hypothetical protein n=1 Tax=Parabacteroides sp. AM08-6 TaxID=2292053 RepID=UPI000EFEF222|nr:hypothetical protein [Parabacteroides sp. AM08-6]RHJ77706.1 hypothetical protein DW103_16050 [Parabacteroides sp. AM08-6]
MIGAAITGGLGLLGGLFGGIKAAKQRKKAQRALNEEKTYNENLFNKEYYSDPLERSDSAALLRNLRKELKERSKSSAATAAVIGATPEAVLADKEAGNKIISDTMSNLGAMNAQYKDNVMNRYLNQRQNLYNQQQQINGQNAQSWTNFMQNGLGTAINSAGSIDVSILNPVGVTAKQIADHKASSFANAQNTMQNLTKNWSIPNN